jgi:hypothetical protein
VRPVKLHFEFLTLFRQKIGRDRLTVQLADRPGAVPTVIDALEALQTAVAGEPLKLVDGGRIARGLLVFRRTPGGVLERIRSPEDQRIDPAEHLVLSIAMEGG